jgi:hypothetical protein
MPSRFLAPVSSVSRGDDMYYLLDMEPILQLLNLQLQTPAL